ncbi:MAG: YitT family protein [Clostridia bacterium]|nr:YitT family protein [Clostridia bacterium]
MKKYGASALIILLGAALYGVGVTVFINPHRVLLGGATGLATVFELWTGIPVGIGMALVNLPLLICSFFLLSKRFSLMAVGGTLVLSLALEFSALLPAFTGDRLLSTLCGAALSGAGVALLCGEGMVTGGSDLLALLLQRKFPAFSFGNLVLAIDVAVILLGGFVYRELETVLYSVLLAAVFTVVLNTYLKGRTAGRVAWIVSKKSLAETIMEKMEHGVTILPGTGGFTGEGKQILLCALRPGEEKALRRIVYEADSSAFMVVTEATEILGFGFSDPKKENIQ